MPKQPGRTAHRPASVDLSQYLVDQFLMPARDEGLCAAGCGRTVATVSRCSCLVPESTVLHLHGPAGYAAADCDLCRHQVKEHLDALLATYLSPVCAHCTLVVETGHPCCLADEPVQVYLESFGENACSQLPGHTGLHRNERGREWV